MTTFARDIEEAADGEAVTHAVIGELGWGDYGVDERHAGALARKGEVLTWAEARPLLDYAYDCGYGAPDCNAVYAYTDSAVLLVVQYDGATRVWRIPRTPTPGAVKMPGC